MTTTRAQQLLNTPQPMDHCTPEELREVRAVWDTLPGHTCWRDALLRLARGTA